MILSSLGHSRIKNACDCHVHIFDPASQIRPGPPPPRIPGISDYRKMQKSLGLERSVVVTPSYYGTNNTPTLKAINELGRSVSRGVAVIHPDISDEELSLLHKSEFRGVRFSLHSPARATTTLEMIEPVARRIQKLGWHTQLHFLGEQISKHRHLLKKLPGTIVFDHMLRVGPELPATRDAIDIVGDLVSRGRTWIKLSGPYLNSQRDDYSDTITLARRLIELAPDRIVWGSDWPHPTEVSYTPDDFSLLALLDKWAPDPQIKRRILVDNPANLYKF
ncbi:amidohydrolase family protein [Candidimonas nitroreducens]|uniref:2-pyrone-4,6-dicarboxylate hydrolase n=1 Tax=Candidimonas nitroreducens TaxID=683354 RepID=A0A225MPX0_9BURK|nr:amidohydrolase family protein [Candidimonas nitroreducens]OWT61970.1 2-pyrone-4,6-dicarboxylate hydrolase [Candidimonas nitroreducens]